MALTWACSELGYHWLDILEPGESGDNSCTEEPAQVVLMLKVSFLFVLVLYSTEEMLGVPLPRCLP